MIENIAWKNDDTKWYASIGDAEAISSKLNELQQTMPNTRFTLQNVESAKDTVKYSMRKGFVWGSIVCAGSTVLTVIAIKAIDRFTAKRKAKKDQEKI